MQRVKGVALTMTKTNNNPQKSLKQKDFRRYGENTLFRNPLFYGNT